MRSTGDEPTRRRIRAVTFDAGGTLFSPREPVGVTYARLARAAGIEADPAALETGFELAFSTAPPLVAPRGLRGAELLAAERSWWCDVVRATLGHALAGADVALRPATFERFFAATFEHYAATSAWTLHTDALPCLDALRPHRLRLGVLSNFDARLHALVEGLGLAPHFAGVFASTELGHAKPDPAAFVAAAGALGAEPAACLHVGDSWGADVLGAIDAGFAAVWLDRAGRAGEDAPAGARRIRSLAELPALLADLDSP